MAPITVRPAPDDGFSAGEAAGKYSQKRSDAGADEEKENEHLFDAPITGIRAGRRGTFTIQVVCGSQRAVFGVFRIRVGLE